MAKYPAKADFPVSQVRRYLEPWPIVLVSSALADRRNTMTMGWHTVMEFTPSLVGCVIASGNHSFDLIRLRLGEPMSPRREAPGDTALHWRRRVHGRRQDDPPAKAVRPEFLDT
jgi:hypothetical protein